MKRDGPTRLKTPQLDDRLQYYLKHTQSYLADEPLSRSQNVRINDFLKNATRR